MQMRHNANKTKCKYDEMQMKQNANATKRKLTNANRQRAEKIFTKSLSQNHVFSSA